VKNCLKYSQLSKLEKVAQNFLQGTSVVFKKAKRKQSPNKPKFIQSGRPVGNAIPIE
jgi:hypothetical protein